MAKPSFPATNVRLKRAYEPASSEDGLRFLVDRLWPRGVGKVDAELEDWLKEIAPSTELRKWFNHEPERWPDFQTRYKAELEEHSETLQHLRDLAKSGTITLVYGTRDEEHNGAIVLRDVLMK